jgi:hypothetical protein
MDAVVHVFYEVAGTIGAFASSIFIKKLGNNYSFIVTPICFAIAGTVWAFVGALDFQKDQGRHDEDIGLAEVEIKRTGILGYFVA